MASKKPKPLQDQIEELQNHVTEVYARVDATRIAIREMVNGRKPKETNRAFKQRVRHAMFTEQEQSGDGP